MIFPRQHPQHTSTHDLLNPIDLAVISPRLSRFTTFR